MENSENGEMLSLDQLGGLVEDGSNDLYQVEATLQAVEFVAEALDGGLGAKYNRGALSAFISYAARNMATQARDISITLNDLGNSVRMFEKKSARQHTPLTPDECAYLLEIISGAETIRVEDLNALTQRLRSLAEENPAMGVLLTAWEGAITRLAGIPLMEEMKGFNIQFSSPEMRVEG